jgi:N-ethylmaleimide reductase
MSNDLFSPLKLAALSLPNRIIMSALTRCRADAAHVPTDIMAEYYSQRATAGLILTEATMVMEGNSAFWREPGIYSAEQVAGWRKVTDAVHAKGGLIMLQLWHGGRACHPLLNGGAQPVAPSAIGITGDEVHTPEGKKPYVTPRALGDDEIPGIIAGFKKAAENAKAAGFDGVEVHGANGYLIDEFLRDGSNQRSGPYGGSIENRARFLLEVTDAAIEVWGPDRVGVRISPLNSYNDMRDSDPVALTRHVASELQKRNVAFLDLMRGDFFGAQQGDVITPAREAFRGALFIGMGYDKTQGNDAIESGTADAIVFGHHYISNPDLVHRLRVDGPVVKPDASTFYTQDAKGYTDYPAMTAA